MPLFPDSNVCTISLNACLDRDENLVAASRQGDTSAFADLYSSHQRRAYLLAYRWSGRSHHDATEIVADSFLSIYRLLCVQGRSIGRFDSYLYTVVRRRTYRVTQNRSGVLYPDVEAALSDLPSESDVELDDSVTEALSEAFQQLTPRHRQVLWMSEIEGLSATDVANYFGITNQAAAALKYRATRSLRAAYLLAQPAPHRSA